MANTTEQRNNMLGKLGGIPDEEKLHADNIIPINMLNRPRLIKEYRYNEFERSEILSWNRIRDTIGHVTFLFFKKVFV